MEKKLPEGWEWRKVKEIARVISGNGAPQDKKYFSKGVYPFIRTSDVGRYGKTNNLLESRDYINDLAVRENKMKLITKGSLLIPKSGESTFLNHRAILAIDAYISSHLAAIIPNKNIMPKYLYYWSQQIDARNLTHDVNYPSLRLSEIESALIPVPPLETQRKIVNILDKAEETKRLRAQSNELTQKLLQSVFLEMFGDPVKNPKGWKVITLENMCSDIVDCPHSTPKYLGENRTFPCIRTTELKNGYMDWSEMKYVDESEYTERTRRLKPVDGDIVFGREGTFGEAVRLQNGYRYCLGQRVMLFRPDTNKCNSEFLWALLNSSCIFNQASMKTSGSTVNHVNVKDIKKFNGFCPPIELQKNFALSLNNIESLRVNQVISGHLSEKLTQNLFQKAFIGELVA